MIQGLGTVIYQVSDLVRVKEWYAAAFQQQPYFDQPLYVGFNVAGYELGLHPDNGGRRARRKRAYWRVADIRGAVRLFLASGAKIVSDVQDVGEGMKVGGRRPIRQRHRVIEHPHFALPAQGR